MRANAPSEVSSLDALRARVRELEGVHVVCRRVRTGVATLDEHFGGLPRPALVEVNGAEGSGRTRLALALAAQRTQADERVAWVDLQRDLYPPAFSQHGVVARRLLLVQPSHDRAEWAVDQIARSGCFPLVIVSGMAGMRRAGPRWSRACELGRCTVLLLRTAPDRRIPATLRFQLAGESLVVTRDRTGSGNRQAPLPEWPQAAHPWG